MDRFKFVSFCENATSLKVLYIQDHAGTNFKCGSFLKHHFKETTIIRHLEIALKIFQSGYYDLIIADGTFLDMKTIQFCKKIKNIAPKKPIVIISDRKDPDELIKYINIGISGFIEIPFDEDQIVCVLSRVVQEIADYKAFFKDYDFLSQEGNILQKQPIFVKQESPALVQAPAIDKKLSSKDVGILRTQHSADKAINAQDFLNTLDDSIVDDLRDLDQILKDLELSIENFEIEQNLRTLRQIATNFGEVATVFNLMVEFADLSSAIRSLSTFLNGLNGNELALVNNIVTSQIHPIYDDLKNWKETIFEQKKANDIHYLDSSLFSSVLQFQLLVTSTIKGEKDEQGEDLELF